MFIKAQTVVTAYITCLLGIQISLSNKVPVLPVTLLEDIFVSIIQDTLAVLLPVSPFALVDLSGGVDESTFPMFFALLVFSCIL